MAKAFVTALPDMKQMIGKFRPPFVATVTPVGNVHVYYTHDKLIQQIARNQTQADNLAEFKKSAGDEL